MHGVGSGELGRVSVLDYKSQLVHWTGDEGSAVELTTAVTGFMFCLRKGLREVRLNMNGERY